MNRSWGVRLSLTAAVSALTLVSITGCGSESEAGSTSKAVADSKATPSTSAAPAAKAATTAELKKLLLATGDIPGQTATAGTELPQSKSEVKVDKAACGPVVWATAGLPPGDTTSQASNAVGEEKSSAAAGKSLDDVSAEDLLNISRTYVGLSSYDGDGAQQAMKAVADGITACADGYSETSDGETTKVTKIAAEKGTGGGDEALAFVETVDVDGDAATVHTEVIRRGNTVATFYTVNFAAFATDGKMPMNPPAIITAQLAKLK